jgi:hypothetical protein
VVVFPQFRCLEKKENDMAPCLLRSGRPPNAGLSKLRQCWFVAVRPDPSLLLVYIMTPLVAGKKHPSGDRLGEVGSRAREQETDDETEESEDGTEDLDDKDLDEPVQQSQYT